MVPDFVVAGHLTLDADNGGYLLGGAAYSALTAARLGRRVGLLTSYGPDLAPREDLEGIQVVAHASPRSAVFRNTYDYGRRRQWVLSAALPLDVTDIPPAWREAPVVHLAPVLAELGAGFPDAFPKALMGASPQGWMRRVDRQGRVCPAPWSWADQILSRLDLLVVSVEDLAGDEALIDQWAGKVRCLTLTAGAGGAWVYYEGQKRHIEAFPARKLVDPTGAGDAFASAFLVKWSEGADPFEAARFASLVASFVVEAKGIAGVPTRQKVEERWAISHISYPRSQT